MPSPRHVIPERSSGASRQDVAGRPVRAFEPGRFARAVSLAVTKLGPRQYRVAGQDEPHYDVSLDADPPCYCRDQEINGRRLGGNCKHVICARLQEREPAAINELIARYEQQIQRLREAGLED